MNQKHRLGLAFVAGMAGSLLVGAVPGRLPNATAQAPAREESVSGLRLLDSNGRAYARLVSGSGQAAHLTFFDQKGVPLLDLGLGGDGLPQLSLMSVKNNGKSKFTLKVAGANQSAVLVFKDNKDRERMRMGLDPDAPGEEPFLVYYDRNMTKKVVFGAP